MNVPLQRPANVERVHFSCDGSIALMSLVPSSFIREGDTASATNPEDGKIYLWSCVPVPEDLDESQVIGRSGPREGKAFAWEPVERWSEERSQAHVRAADLVAVVADPAGGEARH